VAEQQRRLERARRATQALAAPAVLAGQTPAKWVVQAQLALAQGRVELLEQVPQRQQGALETARRDVATLQHVLAQQYGDAA
jgi:hypothetical protein